MLQGIYRKALNDSASLQIHTLVGCCAICCRCTLAFFSPLPPCDLVRLLHPASRVVLVAQFQGGALAALRMESKYTGPDFTATGLVALGQRLGGTGVGLNYFQGVSRYLSLGGTRHGAVNL